MHGAGPLVNGVLAILSLTLLGVLEALDAVPRVGDVSPLWLFGLLNVVLCLFNLVPIPPLDGSSIVGSFVPAFGRFLRRPENAKYTWMAFGLVFLLAGELFSVGATVASGYVNWVVGLGLFG